MPDASYTPIALHLTVNFDRHPALRQTLETALGVPLAAPGKLSGHNPLTLWQGPQDWLIIWDTADVIAQQERLAIAVADKPVLLTLAGDGLTTFTFTGPDAAERLSSGTSLELGADAFPVRASAITRFAQVRAILYHEADSYSLIVECQYARHIELWLARPTS
jgi:heterotetrameric sarcosine oxidase gamma subunit